MKKSLLTLLVAVATVTGTDARTLSPEQALGRAMSERVPSRSAADVKKVPLLTLSDDGAPMVYLFENASDEGFIVVSADDIAAPVLGYSDTGKLDPMNLPVNLRWWLDQYKGEIAAAVAAGVDTPYAPERSRADRSPIAPLMTTRWNQDDPYNIECPLVGSARAMTGCVATAMAQVLKYHNYPEKGVSKHEYKSGTQTIQFDFGNTTFDWNNMLDTYTTTSTTTQNKAVATLMKACGVSVDMAYGARESGAVSSMVTPALITYFNYDKGVHSEVRVAYTSTEWQDMIYNDLAKNGPVYYAGQSNDGGHAFVCDGYSSNGYFHFNWGWGGMSDGYYLLNALDPDSQGIGGSTSGFNFDQMVILGVKKPVAGSEYAAPNYVYSEKLNAQVINNVLHLVGSVFNYSSKAYKGHFSVDFVNDATGETKTVQITDDVILAVGSGYSRISGSINLPDGSYKGTIMFVTGGEKYPVHLIASQLGYITLVKKGTSYTVNVPDAGNIAVKDIEFASKLYVGEKFKFKATAVNTGSVEITMPVTPLLLKSEDTNDWCALGEDFNAIVPANSSIPMEYLGSINRVKTGFTLTAGKYYFCLAVNEESYNGSSVVDNYKAISPVIPVDVKSNNGVTPVVKISSWSLGGSLNAVDPYNIEVDVTVTGSRGYYTSPIEFYVFPYVSGSVQSVASALSEPLFIEAGETKDIKIMCNLAEQGAPIEPGTKYFCSLYNRVANDWFVTVPDQIVFTIGTSGIEDITTDVQRTVTVTPNPAIDYATVTAPEEITGIQLVSMSGATVTPAVDVDGAIATVDVASLPAGIYIARVTTLNGVYTTKVVKK